MRLKNGLMVLCMCLYSLGFSCRDSETQPEPLHTFPENIVCEGDIVFRTGRSWVSRFILLADKESIYSHIGIVVYHDHRWKVVHAVPGEPDFPGDKDRVKMDDLTTFFKSEYAKHGALMRFDTDSISNKAAKKAVEIFLRNVLFDHEYDLEDSTKMYCTEMIHFVFDKSGGVDLTEGRRSKVNSPATSYDYILPSDIEKNSHHTGCCTRACNDRFPCCNNHTYR